MEKDRIQRFVRHIDKVSQRILREKRSGNKRQRRTEHKVNRTNKGSKGPEK
jgi:hypothetical protein